MRLTSLATACLLALTACGDDATSPGSVDAGGIQQGNAPSDAAALPSPGMCDIVAPPSACPSPEPKFADVQPIFEKQCGMCHGASWTGEWPLVKYGDISDWQDSIRTELVTCAMPPADGGIYIPLSDRMKILEWLKCGLPK